MGSSAKKGSSKVQKKIGKVEGAPKRPMSAFFLFLNKKREEIKENNPGIKLTEIGGKGSEMWNACTTEEKEPYEKEYAELKKQYEIDSAAFAESDKGKAAMKEAKSVKKTITKGKSKDKVKSKDKKEKKSKKDKKEKKSKKDKKEKKKKKKEKKEKKKEK